MKIKQNIYVLYRKKKKKKNEILSQLINIEPTTNQSKYSNFLGRNLILLKNDLELLKTKIFDLRNVSRHNDKQKILMIGDEDIFFSKHFIENLVKLDENGLICKVSHVTCMFDNFPLIYLQKHENIILCVNSLRRIIKKCLFGLNARKLQEITNHDLNNFDIVLFNFPYIDEKNLTKKKQLNLINLFFYNFKLKLKNNQSQMHVILYKYTNLDQTKKKNKDFNVNQFIKQSITNKFNNILNFEHKTYPNLLNDVYEKTLKIINSLGYRFLMNDKLTKKLKKYRQFN